MNNLMKFILFLYLITFLKAHPSDKPPAGRIIGGHEAWPHSHPYIVSLQLRILGLRVHYCGGSLLNHYWVLTAGHCVRVSWFYQLFLLDVAAGAHNVYNHDVTTQFRTVEKRVPHPQYLGGITENDIALLKVNFPFKYTSAVQPIRLPGSKKSNLKNLVLSGWGALKTTYFIPAMPDLLQEVKVSYISYKDCYRALEDLEEDGAELLLKENIHICTGPLYGGVAACSGDSGGPLIAYIDSNTSNFNIDYLNDFINEEYETLEEEESSTTPGSFWSRLHEIVDKYFSPNEFVNSNVLNDHSNDIDNKEIIIHKQHAEVQIERIPIVVGVVSWGITPCGYKGAPSVYTNVSHYMDFIRKYINT